MNKKVLYHSMLAIAVPIALQNLITVAVQMADTIMLGSLGEIELSASSLVRRGQCTGSAVLGKEGFRFHTAYPVLYILGRFCGISAYDPVIVVCPGLYHVPLYERSCRDRTRYFLFAHRLHIVSFLRFNDDYRKYFAWRTERPHIVVGEYRVIDRQCVF